jgi:hypothetical protein
MQKALEVMNVQLHKVLSDITGVTGMRALGAFYRRMRARLGAPKAITAAARKLAATAYRMLKYGEAFVERGQEAYEQQYKARVLASLRRSARHLGFQLVAEPVS